MNKILKVYFQKEVKHKEKCILKTKEKFERNN